MKKSFKKSAKKALTFTVTCALLAGGITPISIISNAALIEGGSYRGAVASGSEAMPDDGEELDPGFTLPPEQERPEEPKPDESKPEDVIVPGEEEKPATPAEALPLLRSNGTGDLWTGWTGSMDFLSGNKGDGTEDDPYQITTKAELMGLSELVAMGMTVGHGEGSYPGDYSGSHFKLTKDIDLGGMSWMPIGFYRNAADMTGPVENVFTGTFDGNGKRISNYKLDKSEWRNAGFFGVLDQAVVKDLTLSPSGSIRGKDNIGILAGEISGSTIFNVTVKGDVKANGAAGGLTGNMTAAIIENCIADVTIDSTKISGTGDIYVGGIAGKAASSTIVDCVVKTGTGGTERIQGKGYVGGITGHQNSTDIYNVAVSGTIGGTGGTAIGGITGLYHAGELKVARFTGTVGSSGLGSNAHEGTFIGNRNTGDHFVYGTDVSYLFADTENKITAGVCGSDVADDNDYKYEDHIGFYGSDLYFTLIQGSKSKPVNDRYFYEELEAGILSIMDDSLSGSGNGFTIDHFAPDKNGNPTKGYLVYVPQINTIANGTNFTDVASLEVKGASSYNRVIDKNGRGAIAAGDKVTITTVPNNTEENKYQIKEAGKNPDRTHNYVTYTDAKGSKKASSYVNGGTYTFTMPGNNTEVTAEYEKVATKVVVSPHEFTYKIVQTRTGNRKTPTLNTTVKDKDGKLIATYINGQLQEAQVQPVNISAVVDNNNQVVDKNVKWTIDDSDLILLSRNSDEDAQGYTGKSASIQVHLGGRFFTDIIATLEKNQSDSGYKDKIPDTIFGSGHQSGGVAVLTASTRPDASFEQKVSTDNCRIGVTFQVLDETYVAGEGAVMDKQALTYEVVRTLTGDRTAPVETITVTAPQSLTATFSPDYFSKKDVNWSSSDTGIAQVVFDPGQENTDKSYRYGLVSAQKDAKWIKNIIATDQGIHSNDPYAKVNGSGSRDVTITVTASDQLGGSQSASCIVTINFKTEDKTRVIPEVITLSEKELDFDLSYTMKGDIKSEVVLQDGFTTSTLLATVMPILAEDELHKPYNKAVKWTSSDPAVTVDAIGNVTPVKDSEWILAAMKTAPYTAEKTVTITAVTVDGNKSAACKVNIKFKVNCIELDRELETFNVVLTASGRRSSPVYTWSGGESKTVKATWYPELQTPLYKTSDGSILAVDAAGVMMPVLDAQWMKDAMVLYPYTAEKVLTLTAQNTDGSVSDSCFVTIKFKYVDNTTSSSGGGGGGGGGGGSSSGVSPSGGVGPGANGPSIGTGAPAGSITGTWVNTADGLWAFASNGRTYTDEWAYIHNPYAAKDQINTGWFRFDKTGHMITGWFTDLTGTMYYLSPLSNGTKGYMVTGWNWILGADGLERCYYFNPVSDGTKGAMLKSATTSDGQTVNEFGELTVNGVVQVRIPAATQQ